MQLRLARLELRDVEQVIDQRQQVLSVLGDDVHVLTLVAGQRAAVTFEQQLRKAEDRVQRGAQLVAHVGEELGLVLVRPVQLAIDGAQSCGLLGRQMEEVCLLDGGRRVLCEKGEELDRVAIQRPSVIDSQHAEQLVTHHHGKAGKGPDALVGHPRTQSDLPVIRRVVRHDWHAKLGHLTDLAHAALHSTWHRR